MSSVLPLLWKEAMIKSPASVRQESGRNHPIYGNGLRETELLLGDEEPSCSGL